MKNLIDYEEELRGWPKEALTKELSQPTGSAPSFLVFSEMKRRERDASRFQGMQKAQQSANRPSMLEEALSGSMPQRPPMPQAGGIGQMQPQMPQPMPPQGQPVGYANGGPLKDKLNKGSYSFFGGYVPTEEDLNPENYTKDTSLAGKDFLNKPRGNPIDPWFVGRFPTQFELDRNPERQKQEEELPPITKEYSKATDAQRMGYMGMLGMDEFYEPQERSGSLPKPPKEDKSGIGGEEVYAIGNSQDDDMARIEELIKKRGDSQRNARAEALMQMGATMMTTPGNFGTAMGEGMKAALGQYGQTRGYNDTNLDAQLAGELGLATLKTRQQESTDYATSRIGAAQIAADAKLAANSRTELTRIAIEQKRNALSEASATLEIKKLANTILESQIESDGVAIPDDVRRLRYLNLYNTMLREYSSVIGDGGVYIQPPKQ